MANHRLKDQGVAMTSLPPTTRRSNHLNAKMFGAVTYERSNPRPPRRSRRTHVDDFLYGPRSASWVRTHPR